MGNDFDFSRVDIGKLFLITFHYQFYRLDNSTIQLTGKSYFNFSYTGYQNNSLVQIQFHRFLLDGNYIRFDNDT